MKGRHSYKYNYIRYRFYPSKIKKILKSVIDERLKNEVFDANTSPALCEELTSMIRARVKTGLYNIYIDNTYIY